MSAGSLDRIPTGAEAGEAVLYVINLCASTSPLALVHPSDPALKRHTFFVTRHREDGRERFRLHMGYFSTQEEAEVLLVAVRDVYPAAWAGPAPTSGAPRRAKPTVAAAAVQPAAAAPVPAAVASPLPVAAATQLPSAAPAPMPAPVAAVATVPPDTSATLNRISNVRAVIAQLSDDSLPKVAAVASPLATGTPAAPAALSAPTVLPVLQAAPRAAEPVAPPSTPPSPAALTPAQTLTLLETGNRLPMAPPAAVAPSVSVVPPIAVAPPTFAPPTVAPPAAVRPAPAAAARAPAPSAPIAPDLGDDSSVRVVTPEDTQTLRDIKLDAERNAPPCFAVQLLWAVTPIDAAAHPHLAIFDAYTLYNVEGSRHGRRWYGLRLGFFKDPSAASQVAYYVRSEYPTVAVVPVALKERDNAAGTGDTARKAAPPPPPPQKPQQQTQIERQGLEGFELLEDDRPRAVKRDVDDGPAASGGSDSKPAAAKAAPVKPAAAGKQAGKPQAKPQGKPTGKRVVVRKPDPKGRVTPGATVPLDETFELLGASTLTIDEGREVINDSALRRKPEKKPEGSGGRLSRLLTRLGGR